MFSRYTPREWQAQGRLEYDNGATPEFFGVAMRPLAPGVQGGASSAQIGALRYVLGSQGVTSSSWRVHDVEDWP